MIVRLRKFYHLRIKLITLPIILFYYRKPKHYVIGIRKLAELVNVMNHLEKKINLTLQF
jgi:hypothetical protein